MARRAVQLLVFVRGGEEDRCVGRAESEVGVALAARGEGVDAVQLEIIDDDRVAGKGILLLLGGLDQQALAARRCLEIGHALEGVDGAGGDVDHQQVLGLPAFDVLRGEDVRRGFIADGRLAGGADHLPFQGFQVDAREAVLGLLVFLFLVDLGLPHVGEGGLDREDADGGVLRPLQAGAAGDHRFRAGLEVPDIQGAVSLLGIDLVAHDLSVRGQLDGADGLPSVVDVMVQGLVLGLERHAAEGCGGQSQEQSIHKISHCSFP